MKVCTIIRLYEFGFAGIVFTLSSIGCVPLDVSNNNTEETYPSPLPWITFYAPTDVVGLLETAAELTHVSLFNSDIFKGALEIRTENVRNFNLMATYLVNNHIPISDVMDSPEEKTITLIKG